jgi:glycerophosphoryl diester phosphodiesterase
VAERYPDQARLEDVRIPALAEVLTRAEALSGGTVRYNIETKISPEAPEESADPQTFAQALVAVLKEAGVTQRAAVQSFDWRTLQAVQAAAPEIATVYLTAEQDWLDNLGRGDPTPSPWLGDLAVDWAEATLPQAIARAGGAVWSPYYRDLTVADLKEAQKLGLRVVVWTVNDPADMASLIDLGVDGIITDYPDRARAVMAEKGLALPPAFSGE